MLESGLISRNCGSCRLRLFADSDWVRKPTGSSHCSNWFSNIVLKRRTKICSPVRKLENIFIVYVLVSWFPKIVLKRRTKICSPVRKLENIFIVYVLVSWFPKIVLKRTTKICSPVRKLENIFIVYVLVSWFPKIVLKRTKNGSRRSRFYDVLVIRSQTAA